MTVNSFECEACGGKAFTEYKYPLALEKRLAIDRSIYTPRYIIQNNVKFLVKTLISAIPAVGSSRLKTKILRLKAKNRCWIPFSHLKMLERNLESCAKFFSDRTVRVCQKCGLGAAFPPLSEQTLIDYYSNSYWLAMERVLRSCNNPRVTTIYKIVRDHIPFEKLKNTIEFGSGPAQLSRFFKENHPHLNISIIEPGENWRELLQSEVKSIFSNIHEVSDTYDMFLSSHSLEHVPDLHEYLGLAIGMVKDNGFLVIEVPNSEEADVIFANENPDFHIPHTYFFTSNSFAEIAKKYGLEFIFAKTFNRSYSQILNNVQNGTNGTMENPKGAYLRVLLQKR